MSACFMRLVKKVKCTLVQAVRPIVGSRGIALLFHDQRHYKGGERSASRPGCSLPSVKTRYPLYRRLGGYQGWSGQVQKILLPPAFYHWTIQPIASRYTNYATGPTL
jgi:hypothetical protein